jgi:NTE family protein
VISITVFVKPVGYGLRMARYALILILSTGLCAGGVRHAVGQTQPPVDESPRIGLVLSGGGARGAAHVGVLKVLEEFDVPVHAIAGTSMGAIVGSLYAAGWAPDEIEAQLAAIDWNAMLTDRLPREHLSFRRREEDREFLTQFELGIEGGRPRLPSGLIAGHNVEARLARLLVPALAVRDFDHLTVPFRAVATDLETGDPVVLRDGDLVLAVRASLSMPAVFAPVELDGRLLVDGGVGRNLPVDVARELGVDRLIVVDAGTPLSDREALRSLLDVSKQLTSVMTQSNTAVQRQSLTDSDILIQLALESLSVLDFQRWLEAVEAGEATARAAETALRPLAVAPERQTATISAARAGFRAPVVVDSVHVVGATGVPATPLRGLIRVRAGDPVDPAVLEADLLRLHGLRLFGRIHVRIVVDEGRRTLEFEPEPRPGGTSSLRFGLGFEDDHGAGTSRFHILSSLWLRQVNRYGGEVRLDLQAGEPRGAAAEFFQPLAPGSPVFLTGMAEHREGERALQVSGSTTRFRAADNLISIGLGLHAGGGGEVRAGVVRGRRTQEPRDDNPDLPTFDDVMAGVAAAITLDGLNDAALPRRGGLGRVQWTGYRTGLGSAFSYDRIEASATMAFPVGTGSVVLGTELGTGSDGTPSHHPHSLGGVFRLTGRPAGSVAGRHIGLVRVIYLRDMRDGRVYFGFSAEAGAAWDDLERVNLDDLVPAGSFLIAARTLVGPIYLALGHAEGGSPTATLAIGRRIASPW